MSVTPHPLARILHALPRWLGGGRQAVQVQPLPLPDFCSLPVLFALWAVGALAALLMWLAPGGARSGSSLSVGMAFVTWLTLLLGISLYKLSPWLNRQRAWHSYLGVWLIMLVIVASASSIVQWLNDGLDLGMLPPAPHRFMRDCTLIAALLGTAILRYFYVLAQWQLRLSIASRAQLEALQARIRPHFLFNSMNTVIALIRIDPQAAERTVENLAELFRAALGQDDARDGTLGEELALIERYLAIEQLRLGDRLTVHRELADLPLDFALPRLLLQPLVENAVHHGIQPSREGGIILLRGTCRDGMLQMEITNPLPAIAAPHGSGHGLDNVRQRVAWRYGSQARLACNTTREGYFTARLYLPLGAQDADIDRRR